MRETGLADSKSILLLEYMNVKELLSNIDECDRVIIPLGSIEPHTEFFPLGTDKIIAERLSIELSRELHRSGKCSIIAPTIGYGLSIEWKKSGATVTLSPLTIMYLLTDIVTSLIEMGFKKIIILNGHGGNSEIIRVVSREIALRNVDVEIIVIDWWRLVSDIIEKYSSTGMFLHSDEIEISLLLYWGIIREEDIRRIEKYIVKNSRLPWQGRKGIEMYASIERDQALIAYGSPDKANARLGEFLVKEFCKRASSIIP